MDPAEKKTEDVYEAKHSGIFVRKENDAPGPTITVTEEAQPNDLEKFVMLLRAIVHDVKGQLTIALMNLEGEELVNSEEKQQMREEVIMALKRATLIADQSLMLTTFNEKISIPKKQIDIWKLLKEMLGPYVRYCSLKNPKAIRWMYGETTYLARAILNLVDNAYKYGADEGDREIMIILDEDETHDYISVKDRGPGLPPNKDDLFSLYQRGSQVKPNGYGIGLASTRNIMTMLGGGIEAKNNEDGPGCTFTLILPKEN